MMFNLATTRGSCLALFLSAILLGMVDATAVQRATAQDSPSAFYFPRSKFQIPCALDQGMERVVRLVLHVSEDEGLNWRQYAVEAPTARYFDFEAYRDGWYWFVVQTVTARGDRIPTRPTRDRVGLKVYVDTARPIVQLRQKEDRNGEVTVAWDIRDEKLDLPTMSLSYRESGGQWRTKLFRKVESGQLTFDPGTREDVEVRIEVKDRAGNLGGATTTFRRTRRADPDTGSLPKVNGISKVNSKRFRLNCQLEEVGDSGVSLIEIWMTSDGGRKWESHRKVPFSNNQEYLKTNKPHEIEVPNEGVYGFTLIAQSGVGLGLPAPRPGDQPQVWVEVDITPPLVRITDVKVGRGIDTGKVTITWSARDKNLANRPVTISYKEKDGVRWTRVPGADRIENAGRFTWQVDEKVPYQFLMKVEAFDEAGNVGKDETPETVKVDLARPKVRVLDVKPDVASPH